MLRADGQQEVKLFPDDLLHTNVRRSRRLMQFDSRDSALRWAERNQPKQPPRCVTVCPPHPRKVDGCWTLHYTVTMPGHVRYYLLGKGGHLVEG